MAMRRPQQAGKHVRTLRQKHPMSLPLMVVHGHLLAAQVKIRPALLFSPRCSKMQQPVARRCKGASARTGGLRLPVDCMSARGCWSAQGHHAEALSEYHHAYRLRPQEPLVLLSIACAYIAQVHV